MPSSCAMSHGPSGCVGMSIRCIWSVDEGENYRVWDNRRTDKLVAICTLDGHGVVEVKDYGRFDLTGDTVFITDISRLQYHGTGGTHWRCFWFEFARESGTGYPWHERLRLTPTPWERQAIEVMMQKLAMPDAASRMAASALFNAVLHEWATRWQRLGERPDAQRTLVFQVIARMQQSVAEPLCLETLAGEFGVSSRWLRLAFTRVMGIAPKAFQTDLRLRQAAQALVMGLGTITQISERFGYASPYHFSRTFKAKYGCSPSEYRNR